MDIGGTFTDLVFYDEESGSYHTDKVSTTPADLTIGVLDGLARSIPNLTEVSFLVHGTTVGINALLERRGERALLLTNHGLRDIYHIARGSRPRMYDLHYRKPSPLIPLTDICEVRCRLDYQGKEIEKLKRRDVEEAAERARDERINSIAVVYLFSHVNPDHELQTEEILREVVPDVSISLSHRVSNEWREYERTSSTVMNAYIAPRVENYLTRLEHEISQRGLRVPLHVMQSSGGVISADGAQQRPLQTLMSGPVGGTVGGVALTKLGTQHNLICVDMGGTSFDVSLVVDGRPDISSQATLEGFPVLMPMVNIHTIGAGGGSLAYIEGGGLRVGPESAGASPGPICYRRGGTQPTVTDANLVLGRLDPEYFLGGEMTLDLDAAETGMSELATTLDLEMHQLAEGIIDVINAKMAQAIRTITVEKGIEPRDFALVAFGGAGPVHAAFLAKELEIKRVVIPQRPGAFSAWGMLETTLRHDSARPFYFSVEDPAVPGQLAKLIRDLANEGRTTLRNEGVSPSDVSLRYRADMRYVGQEYSVAVDFDGDEIETEGFVEAIQTRFHQAHANRYGHSSPAAPVEFVNLRVAALGDLQRHPPSSDSVNGSTGDSQPATSRSVVFDGIEHNTVIAYRPALTPGTTLSGPAIIEEPTATTVVPPGVTAEVDVDGTLLLNFKGRS
jgi:N-methylhydantoinase A